MSISMLNTCSLLHLPNELLDEVANDLAPGQLASLCRVSKLFNSTYTRFLYRAILLTNPWEIVSCCKTLARNVSTAHSVRTFGIMSDSVSSEYSSAFFRLLISALKHATGITYLVLQFRYGRLHLDTLGDCHFPKLRTLVIGISLTPPIATFISRCRELRLLCLFPIIDDQHTHIPPIGPLPQLQVFKGTNQFLSSVIPGSPVNSVAISMDIHGTFDSVLDELKKSTTPITDIEYTAPGWDFLDFFTGLLCQFPDIESIKYYSIMPLPLILRGIFMARLVHLLPGFTQLRHLEITDFYVLRNEQDDGLDHIEDPEYADIWWSVCPQLVSCRLPSAIQWLRNPEAKHLRDRWYPDHHDARTRAWLRNISRGDLSQFDWITNLIDALGIPQDLRSESTDKKSDDGGGEANGSEGGEEGSSDGGNDS